MMYAKVIVDVPAKQTNRAFDYRIPAQLREWVDIGSRVGVPFGSRIVQGFVVEIGDQASVDENKVKEIDHVLDVSPPLTPELVELARWMSRKYLCHEITALQAMLPGALKAKYVRRIQVSDDCPAIIQGSLFGEESEIVAFVRKKGGVSMEALLARFPSLAAVIKRMIREGVLVERQIIRDRNVPKKVLTVFPPDSAELLKQFIEKVPASAPRQKEVLQYFLHHPGPVKMAELIKELSINAATIRGLAEKGWIALKEMEEFRDPLANRTFPKTTPLPLTAEQRQVFEQIRDSLASERHEVFLLHGVTGSGKTEVYLQSIQQCLDQGREAIVLVPEISLTPQMVETFKSRFGDQVAVLHSRLSDGERYDEWRKIIQRKVRVAIGARSAVFAPFTRLGLIIIDEEHESSYKQEESPKYHAREVAIRRGRHNRAAVILGSATPSLESYYLATTGPVSRSNRPGTAMENMAEEEEKPYRLLSMSSRVHGRPLPPVRVVDMREELKSGNRSMFSRALYHALKNRLEKNEQAVLLLNRRGYATFVLCRSCGAVIRCPHCDISLTYHQTSKNLRCHYCGYAEREAKRCPDCASEHIRHFGAGTQRVEEELGRLFPGIRVIRMDVDTTTEKGSHEKWLTMFRRRQADVLLGTQMVAKGLDFPFVTLVGVVAADTVLNLPDFRSAEKTFQLLTQVAGRAGRHELPGEVIVQTYSPEHYSINYASRHDYTGFIDEELKMRRMRGYPPYRKLALITLSHEELPFLVRSAEILAKRLRELFGHHDPGFIGETHRPHHQTLEIPGKNVEIFGPIASPIPRIKDRYRFQCMIKYQGNLVVSRLIAEALQSMEEQVRQCNLQINVDIDPQVLL